MPISRTGHVAKLFYISLFALPLFFAEQASAWSLPFFSKTELQIPELVAPVMDQAEIIGLRQEEVLNQILREFNQRGKAQISILTVATLQGISIEEAALKVAEKWKLGTAQKDNGIVILVSAQDRKARIEVGQGLEGDLPDVIAKRILADTARPYFKKGLYGEGLYAAVMQILNTIDPEFSGGQAETNSQLPLKGNLQFFILLLIFFVVFPVLSLLSRKSRGGVGPGGFAGGGWGSGGFGGGGFGGGGSSGGGGWSGGGGGFSGGGASDGW